MINSHKANLLRWIVTIVLLAPQLSIHLQAHVCEINVTSDIGCHVFLGDIVLCMLPVTRRVTRYFLPVDELKLFISATR